MRERLIQLISNADEECKHSKDCKSCSGYGKGSQCMNYHIADYLIKNGVIVPPCKVGDKIYYITPNFLYIKEYEVVGFHIGDFPTSNGHKRNSYLVCYEKLSRGLKHIPINVIDKIAFFKREEAERAVKGGATE